MYFAVLSVSGFPGSDLLPCVRGCPTMFWCGGAASQFFGSWFSPACGAALLLLLLQHSVGAAL